MRVVRGFVCPATPIGNRENSVARLDPAPLDAPRFRQCLMYSVDKPVECHAQEAGWVMAQTWFKFSLLPATGKWRLQSQQQ